MPSLADFAFGPIKCLSCGRPGTGKTGQLISIVLADPEARLFIANYDRGNIGTLASLIQFDPLTKAPRPPEIVARLRRQVQFHNFQDNIQTVNNMTLITGIPTAFSSLGGKLNKWDDEHKGMNEWGPKDWLVLDSISAMGEGAMRSALYGAERLNKRPEQSDWGEAIQRLSLLLEMTNDPKIPCNVMAITHIRFVGDLEGPTDPKTGKPTSLDMVPNALGQKLPQEIGRYFNNIIETRVVGEGPGERRVIYTRSPGQLVLRSSNPAMVKPEYPITGLADWVRDIRSTPAPPPAAPPAQPQPQTGTLTAPPPAAN